jgi:lipopolysaccharide export system permease protein
MRVLDRYLVATLCRHTALALAVLVVLAGLFLFVNEQGWVGAGTYGQVGALRFVLAQLPATALQFLPVAALLGALLALGELARGSELTVMRAAGVSVARLAGSVVLAGVVLVPPAVVMTEWIAPPLAERARIARALERQQHPGGAAVAWRREGATIVRADAAGVTAFELHGSQLAAVTSVQELPDSTAEPASGRQALRLDFGATGVALRRVPASIALPAAEGMPLPAAAVADPRQQSLSQLAEDIRTLRARGHDATTQRLALWTAIARLPAVPLAMLLALPLLLGYMREAGTGARASVGLVIGLVYFLAQRTVENGTRAFGLDPLLLAWTPTLLLALAAAALLWQVRCASVA